jgi:NAD-dependent SIR2 family protein deacetylase
VEPDRLAVLNTDWAAGIERVAVLTGAGVSTDSGIPDYRGPDDDVAAAVIREPIGTALPRLCDLIAAA